MKTIKEELESIAKVCNTSDEFTIRAKNYLRDEKGINQSLMSDGELRDIFRKVDYDREKEKAWKIYDEVIEPSLTKRPECKGLWYEVWIDLSEDWIDKWFSSFRYMENKDIIEVCVKYLNDRERFYGSSDYTDMLDKMVAECDFSK
jgi:hypothetical protein